MSFNATIIIDADRTEHGWEIALRMPVGNQADYEAGSIANYEGVSDPDLFGIVGAPIAAALIADHATYEQTGVAS